MQLVDFLFILWLGLRTKYKPLWREVSVVSDTQVTVKARGPLVSNSKADRVIHPINKSYSFGFEFFFWIIKKTPLKQCCHEIYHLQVALNSLRLEIPGGIPSSPVRGSGAWSRTGRPCGPGCIGEAPSCGQSHGVRKKGLRHILRYKWKYIKNTWTYLFLFSKIYTFSNTV